MGGGKIKSWECDVQKEKACQKSDFLAVETLQEEGL